VGTGVKPYGTHDYFEPRVAGRKYNEPSSYYFGGSVQSDSRKLFSLFGEFWRWKTTEDNTGTYFYGITPAFRANDRLSFSLHTGGEFNQNRYGYETHRNDSIVFAKRHITEQNTVFTTNYIFTSKMAISLRSRFYRSVIEKLDFHLLNEDGSLDREYEMQYEWSNENRSSFNIDLVYTWQFAPGSEISVVWKNAIWFQDDIVDRDYFSSLNDTWNSPQNNSFSIKILYYLDYLYLKKSFKSNG
jgi:hypothetical protein